MKGRILLLVGAACMLLAPTMAWAAVVGSAHDMPLILTLTGSSAKAGTCSFCHTPHKASAGAGDKLFPAPPTMPTGSVWNGENIAAICWSCHNTATTYGQAAEANVINDLYGHKRNAALLTVGGAAAWGRANAADPADITTGAAQWTAVAPTFQAGNLRCTSCHDVHSNLKKPFLKWGVSGDYSGLAGTGFCGQCHLRRNSTLMGTANVDGLHPARNNWADTGANSPLLGGATIPGRFNVNMINLNAAGVAGGKWNLGGHSLWSSTTGQSQTMVCGTCHLVHSNETATFSSQTDGGGSVLVAQAAGGSWLLAQTQSTGALSGSEPICKECHSTVDGPDARGPGAVNTVSHPIGTGSPWGTAMSTASRGYMWGPPVAGPTGTGNAIICESCHDMHYARSNTTLHTYDIGEYCLASNCVGCHTAAGASLADHHPTTTYTVTAGTQVYSNFTTTAINWLTRSRTASATNTYGFPSVIDCTTCHGGANAGAHNNPSSVGFPGLTGPNDQSQMCVDCHSFNPSAYSTVRAGAGFMGTHWVGSISTPSYKKTTQWVRGFSSKWGTGGTNGTIICESCHSLWINGRNNHTVTYQYAYNLAADTITQPTISLMVQNSGNTANYTVVTDYMCTTCHGASPGGTNPALSASHPTLPNYTLDATIAAPAPASYINGHAAGAGARINCESCHRPHDAISASGTDFGATQRHYILESATVASGYVNASGLCSLCHVAY